MSGTIKLTFSDIYAFKNSCLILDSSKNSQKQSSFPRFSQLPPSSTRWTDGTRVRHSINRTQRLAFLTAAQIGSENANGFTSPSNDSEQLIETSSKTVFVIKSASFLIVLGTLIAASVTVLNGGPTALVDALTKSGFAAAFSLIFMSEIGDKTFFIAAIMAMTHSKYLVLAGASSALALMSVISVVLGRLFRKVPAQLSTTLPVGEYLAIALLVWFGFRNIRAALASPAPAQAAEGGSEEDGGGELAEAQEFVSNAKVDRLATPWDVFREAFCLVFVAEWGDRSMLATIALGAAQSPVGVALGASVGHVIATGMAVMGGSLMAKYISEKLVNLTSGILFIAFAVATYFGVF